MVALDPSAKRSSLCWIPLTCELADRAAALRAEHRFSTADAIHVATALDAGATAFVTNDRDLPPVPGIEYLQLADFAA